MAARDGRARKDRPQSARAGAVPSIIVIGVLMYLANVAPGWWALPFLTSRTAEVMGAVNAAWIAGLVANAVYLLVGVRAVRALGEIIVIVFGIVATFRIWSVFPFDFGASSFDWALIVRILLVVAIVGSFIGIIAQLAAFVRAILPHPSGHALGQ
ncbi:hypothetical protein GCM10012320_21520 [Sinomonas cellulolyticus]|jgi:hypothetical protein|uniref:Uncharacterized protein n=1 Tax=Sinomonas cellulolyticus TaxID=2801916 RepID=A0ABS1K1Y6_9MICC|nr:MULTISPECIES: hypothetical protein [Sinomonas]MBL0705661.1 hypothetical protein [Sinomonas cellulolyticus]GHG51811.1 hypothetical protein GCM10012320_21520 [Sinomonas sp. KCTC 49339]